MPLAYLSAAPRLWLVRFLALSALAASLGITLWKWMRTGPLIPGCGEGGGCEAVLESRWSLWFSVPVTLLAATLWLTVLVLTLPRVQTALGRTADQLLAATGALLVGGAFWFGGLLVGIVKVWCVWCLALHFTALLVGGLILYSIWRAEKAGGPGLLAVASQTACAGLALLVLGQIFGTPPDTHYLTSTLSESPAAGPSSSPLASVPAGRKLDAMPIGATSREVTYLDGSLILSLADHPLLGSARASHILVEFFDYTCPTCRTLHGDLSDLQKSAPGEYAVLLLPVPLNHDCNPSFPDRAADHPYACELARLALAFWRAAPAKFPAFHEFLMTAAAPLTPEAARNEARRLAPAANFTEATSEPVEKTGEWISARIAANVEIWSRISTENSKMPKLLLRDALIMHGAPVSRERFQEVIQSAFPVGIPLSDIPVINPGR